MFSDESENGTCSLSQAEQKRFKFLNTYVNALSLEETVFEVEEIIRKKNPTQHVVINASKVNLMRDDEKLRSIVNSCPIINADGSSIVWAAKQLGLPLADRVTGIDLFLRLVQVSAEKNYSIYLFGATEEVVKRVKACFEEEYPSLRIAGYRNGYFGKEDEPEMLAEMESSKADILFVAFSSPKKEYWVHENLNQLSIPFVMGVGGSFDVVAGKTKRAPSWMQKMGLEWFYRFIQEPGRLWRRYIVGNVRFVSYVYRFKFGLKDG